MYHDESRNETQNTFIGASALISTIVSYANVKMVLIFGFEVPVLNIEFCLQTLLEMLLFQHRCHNICGR